MTHSLLPPFLPKRTSRTQSVQRVIDDHTKLGGMCHDGNWGLNWHHQPSKCHSHHVLFVWSHILLQVHKGASGSRGDDMKTLKGNILEWITPKGQSLNPPLYWNQKVNRGFHHKQTGVLLYPVDEDPKATCSGNAHLHNMTHATPASVTYIATQVPLLNAQVLFIF